MKKKVIVSVFVAVVLAVTAVGVSVRMVNNSSNPVVCYGDPPVR